MKTGKKKMKITNKCYAEEHIEGGRMSVFVLFYMMAFEDVWFWAESWDTGNGECYEDRKYFGKTS